MDDQETGSAPRGQEAGPGPRELVFLLTEHQPLPEEGGERAFDIRVVPVTCEDVEAENVA